LVSDIHSVTFALAFAFCPNPQDGRGERRMGIPGWCCEGFHVCRVRMILMGFNYDSIGIDRIYMEFTLQ
jgi:hypothetical protein